eukprot:SAG31_NODE_191_length_20809_cov_64.613761_13_plen_91_part_00
MPVKLSGSTSDRVLGTQGQFLEKLRENPAEGRLAQAAISKYMQNSAKHDLPSVGAPFRDGQLVTLAGEPVALSSLASSQKPLVLNFGSCS